MQQNSEAYFFDLKKVAFLTIATHKRRSPSVNSFCCDFAKPFAVI